MHFQVLKLKRKVYILNLLIAILEDLLAVYYNIYKRVKLSVLLPLPIIIYKTIYYTHERLHKSCINVSLIIWQNLSISEVCRYFNFYISVIIFKNLSFLLLIPCTHTYCLWDDKNDKLWMSWVKIIQMLI